MELTVNNKIDLFMIKTLLLDFQSSTDILFIYAKEVTENLIQ